MENIDKCTACGALLNKKEMLTKNIYDKVLCDICTGTQRRIEYIKSNYLEKLKAIPAVYVDGKFAENALISVYGKSAVILADEAPVSGTQWAWDMIKMYWRNGRDAMHVSSKDIATEYASISWRDKKDYMDVFTYYPGMLVVDDISIESPKEQLSRIIEYRAEWDIDTVIIIHMSYDDLDRVIGDKAYSLIKSKWKCLSLERK